MLSKKVKECLEKFLLRKSLNIECESEKEVDKWIKYIHIVINYFKKTKAIKGAVLVKTKTFG